MSHYIHGKGLHGQTRRRIKSRTIKIVIIFAALSIVFIIIGIIYTWFTGQKTRITTTQPTTSPRHELPKPASPDPDAAVGVAVQTLSSPIAPGDNAALSIHTIAESVCVVKVSYNNVPVNDSGLTEKIADEYGLVSWSWTVRADAPLGTWPVDITCTRNKHSGYLHQVLKITENGH